MKLCMLPPTFTRKQQNKTYYVCEEWKILSTSPVAYVKKIAKSPLLGHSLENILSKAVFPEQLNGLVPQS